jgi:hypothetical protein
MMEQMEFFFQKQRIDDAGSYAIDFQKLLIALLVCSFVLSSSFDF